MRSWLPTRADASKVKCLLALLAFSLQHFVAFQQVRKQESSRVGLWRSVVRLRVGRLVLQRDHHDDREALQDTVEEHGHHLGGQRRQLAVPVGVHRLLRRQEPPAKVDRHRDVHDRPALHHQRDAAPCIRLGESGFIVDRRAWGSQRQHPVSSRAGCRESKTTLQN